MSIESARPPQDAMRVHTFKCPCGMTESRLYLHSKPTKCRECLRQVKNAVWRRWYHRHVSVKARATEKATP